MPAKTSAKIEDLYRVPEDGKAELVGGEVKLIPHAGDLPSRAAGELAASLHTYQRLTARGRVYPGKTAFLVNLPNRRSFSPDASYYIGPRTRGKFLEGAPVFAAEVRSEGDYGPAAEREMAAKRSDYFAAGTQVVWDVDVLKDEVVRVFRAGDRETPTVYRRGELAEAEPALPGWTLAVDELFS